MPPGLLLPTLLALVLRPYVPPDLGPEPAFFTSNTVRVEVQPANNAWDANVFARPHYMAPLVGNIARGTRVTVRGELRPPDGAYCATGMYYAIEPFGWLCSADARPTDMPNTTTPVLELVPETPLPYRYVMVRVAEGSGIPMWSSVESLEAHESEERLLERGDTVALWDKQHTFEGARYYITVDGKVLPVRGTMPMTSFSTWRGTRIDETTHFPFGWVTKDEAPVFAKPGGKKVEALARRARVDVLAVEEQKGGVRWLQIGEERYVRADHVNEVRRIARPEDTGTHRQWIDVDLGEQVVVAYEGQTPVYATLTSSGRGTHHTPRGNYPVWGKSSAITMKSQPYDDSAYYVDRVPWVLFFQAHNALHGAYWHDRFGVEKSHGCANLAPNDARLLFDWLEPRLPPGWTAVRYWNLNDAPVVHVRNSARDKPFFQERNIGPPDPDEETERLENALRRREARARRQAEEAQGMVPQSPLITPQRPVPSPSPALPAWPLR